MTDTPTVAERSRLMAQLKADWEARPANMGITVKYTELWDNLLTQKNVGDEAKPPTPSRPIDLAGDATQQEGGSHD